MPIRIALLATAQPDAVEALLDAAFGVDRHGRTAYRIRAGTVAIPSLSLAAFDADALAGTLQSWPVFVGDAPVVLVGPVAVAPLRQRMGIGTALMRALIEAAPDLPMTMIGDPEYYGQFGFSADATARWAVPGPIERHRLLARNANALPAVGQLAPDAFAIGGRSD